MLVLLYPLTCKMSMGADKQRLIFLYYTKMTFCFLAFSQGFSENDFIPKHNRLYKPCFIINLLHDHSAGFLPALLIIIVNRCHRRGHKRRQLGIAKASQLYPPGYIYSRLPQRPQCPCGNIIGRTEHTVHVSSFFNKPAHLDIARIRIKFTYNFRH